MKVKKSLTSKAKVTVLSSYLHLNGLAWSSCEMSSRWATWTNYLLLFLLIGLQEPANAQQSFSTSSHPTVWRTIPVLEFLQETWGDMATSSKFGSISPSIDAGLKNLSKWYRKTDDTSVYFVCLGTFIVAFVTTATYLDLVVLDPNVKAAYAKDRWATNFFKDGMKSLEKVVSSIC